MEYKIISNVNMIYVIKAETKEKALNLLHNGDIKPIETEVLYDEFIK